MSVGASIHKYLKGDKYIWLILLGLTLASVLAVYSASGGMAHRYKGGDTEHYLIRHFLIIALGLGVTFICYKLDYMIYSRLIPLIFLVAIGLLIYTFFWGIEINEARRWVKIPIINLSFQTSDFGKLALIIFVARSISRKQAKIKEWGGAFVPIIFPIFIICLLIAPSDLSTSILLFVTCMLMMFVGRIKFKYIGLLILAAMVGFAFLILVGSFFPDIVRVSTWIGRVQEFLASSESVYQVQQSLIAIANGEWFGVGPGNSIQRNYLPYPYADFIFAIICEEYGLLGGLSIIAIFMFLLFRCSLIVYRSPKAFGAILAFGLALNLVIQAFANIAVSVNLVPVTGLTLPFVSMGGTSMLFSSISIGIILSVSRYIERVQAQEAQEKLVFQTGRIHESDY